MDISKSKTYVGFAKKSGAIVYGVDTLCLKKTDLIYLSEELSQSSKQKCLNFANKNNTKVYVVKQDLINQMMDSNNVKAFGVKNKQLSKAIQICQE